MTRLEYACFRPIRTVKWLWVWGLMARKTQRGGKPGQNLDAASPSDLPHDVVLAGDMLTTTGLLRPREPAA